MGYVSDHDKYPTLVQDCPEMLEDGFGSFNKKMGKVPPELLLSAKQLKMTLIDPGALLVALVVQTPSNH